MNRRYTTDALITNYLNKAVADEEVKPFILATQKYIEEFTGRVFKADSDASIRKYNGNDRRELIIDDCIEVTKVELGNDQWGDSFSTISSTGTDRYYTLPTNNSEEGYPIRKLGLRNRIWIWGHANHQITAKWGWSENVPEDIKFAATVLASGMFNANRGENTGAIKSEKIGEYNVTYADSKGLDDVARAREILNQYKKYEL